MTCLVESHVRDLMPGTSSKRQLNSTRLERLLSTHDTLKAQFVRMWNRWCWFITLQNIAALLLISVVIAILSRGQERPLSDFGLIRYESSFDALEEIDKRLQAMRREQDDWKEMTSRSLHEMELHMSNNVLLMQENMQRELKQLRASLADRANSSASTVSQLTSEKLCHVEDTVVAVEKRMEQAIEAVKSQMEKIGETVELASSAAKSRIYISRINLASQKAGAAVIPLMSSSQFVRGSFVHRLYANIWSLSHYQWPVMDRSTLSAGDAFCFEGSEGNLTIRLSARATVFAVQYEHDFWTETVPVSAPQEYDVLAASSNSDCDSEFSCHFELASQCTYGSGRGSPAQICVLETPSEMVDLVQLRVTSNHGQKYTCLYNVKVFGGSNEQS